MSESPRESCQTCLFYLNRDGSRFASGVCRRYPPLVVLDEMTHVAVSVRPSAQPASWCGEWKPNESNEANLGGGR